MAKLSDENYYSVFGWMINQLGLKGVQLQIYSIIYSISQDGESEYYGSLSYLEQFTGTTKPTVIKALRELCEKGYIKKRSETISGVQVNRYSILQVVKKFNHPGKEILPDPVKKFNHPGKEILPNNKDNNKRDNKKEYIYGPFEEFAKDNKELLEALKAFEEMRKTIKKPLTEKAKQMVCNKLEKMAEDFVDKERYMIESLEQSTVNCYQGVFPVKDFEDNKPKIFTMPEDAFPEWKPGTGQTWEDLVP